jgi:hypothetical protein
VTDVNVVPVEISRLKPHPSNARTHDVPKIQRSLERFGQVNPIVVQKSTGYIIKGHGTVEAATRLKWSTIDVQIVDMDDDTALGYLIADNATSDSSGYDKRKLLGVLQSALSLEGLGFDEDDIEALNEDVNGKKETKKAKPSSESIKIEVEDKESESSKSDAEPMREIPLRMPADQIQEFSKLILDLQRAWGARTLIEVVGRAVKETHDRWQAHEAGGARGSEAGLPELSTEF